MTILLTADVCKNENYDYANIWGWNSVVHEDIMEYVNTGTFRVMFHSLDTMKLD